MNIPELITKLVRYLQVQQNNAVVCSDLNRTLSLTLATLVIYIV